MKVKNAKIYIIEGFPKNRDNAEAWNRQLSGRYHVIHVFYFHCSIDVLEKRLVNRGKNSGRADDKLEVIKERLEKYKN